MVTPTTATISATGLQSGKPYSIPIYIADVADALVHFDGGSGASATSPQDFDCPEDMVIEDISVKSGPTVIFSLQPASGNALIQNTRYQLADFLNSLPARPKLRLGFRKGSRMRFYERV